MEYNFNELDAFKFQRLINCILNGKFGVDVRITPLYGADGGRDAETASGNPFFDYKDDNVPSLKNGGTAPPSKGRYIFQVKHHRTTDTRITDARQAVLSDFENELKKNVLNKIGKSRVNYFFLITNVPGSKDALEKLDKKRSELLRKNQNLHADIWWKEQIISFLDGMPNIWSSFPEIFAGGKIPFIAEVMGQLDKKLPRAVRMAIDKQFERDSKIKFRQINLENNLSKLFVDLNVNIEQLTVEQRQQFIIAELNRQEANQAKRDIVKHIKEQYKYNNLLLNEHLIVATISILGVLLCEADNSSDCLDGKDFGRKIILEGGPGQGKSTITQMVVQIYRERILGKNDLIPEDRWIPPSKHRLPFRVELRKFAELLNKNTDSSVEEYLCSEIKRDSGGVDVTPDDIHSIVELSPIMLVFDGLDEVGSDTLRNEVITKIIDCVDRFEKNLSADLRVIITTRPPAIAGRRERLGDFTQIPIASMDNNTIQSYLDRWLSVQLQQDKDEQTRVRESFERRQNEPLVKPLIKNPMQLSVLLHFIRLKDEAFPDNRAQIYKEYFQIIIDRDVEKSAAIRHHRKTIEALHQFLAYKIHALTEAKQADGTLARDQLLNMVKSWLKAQGNDSEKPEELFKTGEERLGLIVTLRGEGDEARYGYEIQPIQEYFSAAYIDEQVKGDPNEIFSAMLRRPYWREVALFLAGLRRPREKADLLMRAKELDKEETLGWRQDGRAMIFQLMQEGALSEPKYVFIEALEFIFELLDYRLINPQNEPERLLEIFPNLLKQNEGRKLYEVLSKLLKDYQECEDEYALYRLYRVTSKMLEPAKMREILLSHKSTSPDLTAKVRLIWPYSWGIDMSEEVCDSSFWEGAPAHVWAENWWRTAFMYEELINLTAPSNFHYYLIIQFAANSIPIEAYRYRKQNHTIKTQSNWAVWILKSYQKIFNLLILSRAGFLSKEINKMDISLLISPTYVDYCGLEKSILVVVQDVIEAYYAGIINLISNEAYSENNLEEYIRKIIIHLKQPGLVSWIALQYANSFLRIILIKMPEPRMLDFECIAKIIELTSIFRELYVEMLPFYKGSVSVNFESIASSKDIRDLILPELFTPPNDNYFVSPKYIRTEVNASVVSLVDILADTIFEQDNIRFDWLNYIPFTTDIVRPLIDKCLHQDRESLPRFLNLLSELRLTNFGHGKPLLTHNMKFILQIARSTDDPKTLNGILVAISTSKFIKSAGSKLILKMLSQVSNQANFFAVLLFRQYRVNKYSRHLNNKDKFDIKELEIIKEVAEGIFKTPSDYSFQIVCAATNYLAEYNPVILQPLQSEEEKLKLQVREL